MFKLKITHAGREIEIEIPISESNYLSYNSKEVIAILKEATDQMKKLNE